MVKLGAALAWLLVSFGVLGIFNVAYVSAIAGDQDFKGPLGKIDWINRNFWSAVAAIYAGVAMGLLTIIAKSKIRP